MSKAHDANNPYITMSSKADPKALALFVFGVPILVLLLAFPFPFFRHVFTFGSVIITILGVFAVIMAYKDKRNGVVRPARPNFQLPKWFLPTFFLTMVIASAGMRLGWYIVPLCWLINWGTFISTMRRIRATYKKEPKERAQNTETA